MIETVTAWSTECLRCEMPYLFSDGETEEEALALIAKHHTSDICDARLAATRDPESFFYIEGRRAGERL